MLSRDSSVGQLLSAAHIKIPQTRLPALVTQVTKSIMMHDPALMIYEEKPSLHKHLATLISYKYTNDHSFIRLTF